MTNPAELLAVLLTRWRIVPPNHTTEAFRGDETWQIHRQAVQHLLDIDRFLRGMEAAGDVIEPYLETMPAWTAAVFAATAPWQATMQAPRPVIDDRDLRMLRALSTLMSSTRYTPVVGADSLDNILDAVGRSEQLIRESALIDDSARRYLLGLVVEAQLVLNDLATYGEVGARRIVYELGGALTTVADQTADKPESAKWRAAATDIMRQLIVGVAMLGIDYEARRLGITQ